MWPFKEQEVKKEVEKVEIIKVEPYFEIIEETITTVSGKVKKRYYVTLGGDCELYDLGTYTSSYLYRGLLGGKDKDSTSWTFNSMKEVDKAIRAVRNKTIISSDVSVIKKVPLKIE